MSTTTNPTFQSYRTEWLSDIVAGDPSTRELGRRFSRKLLTQWLDVDDSSDDLVYCDGAGDGGIDIAYLARAENADPVSDGATGGDTWYLVQSKYGSAFQGPATLLIEGQKVIDTLDGQRSRLSSLAQGLLERLTVFRSQCSELDRIVLTYATELPLSEDERRVLTDVRAMGRERLGAFFDVEAVSIQTIHDRLLDEMAAAARLEVSIQADLVPSGQDLLVGSVSLLNLYRFLKAYRDRSGDLDQLYEKNVRRFLGGRGRVNRAMQQTLKETPAQFGLYNNGITIVVADFQVDAEGTLKLTDPYVVNGCQTTRTIWEVCHQRMEAGGSGSDPGLDRWRQMASEGVVIAKVVRVGSENESLLQAITRFTNSQNAVREQDFLALTSDFRTWARQLETRYDVYLETQRGGWDSRRAFQNQNPSAKQFTEAANAFDLLKVYGAGWLGEAGSAFGRNAAFLPNGIVFRRIVENVPGSEPFGVDDLYASYRLMRAAESYKFGRSAEKDTRRITRSLFYMVAGELLKDILVRAGVVITPRIITRAMLNLYGTGDEVPAALLLDTAIQVIDEYLTPGTDDSVFQEPPFQEMFSSNLNGYLKWEQLGKTKDASPRLHSLISGYGRMLGRATGGQPAPRDLITAAVR